MNDFTVAVCTLEDGSIETLVDTRTKVLNKIDRYGNKVKNADIVYDSRLDFDLTPIDPPFNYLADALETGDTILEIEDFNG